MTKPVIITADSVCDLSPELAAQWGVQIIPLTVVEGDRSYKDGLDIHPDMIYDIYEKEHLLPKTTAISPQEFLDFFTPMVEKGYEVAHIDISSKLSGTYQNACIAAGELEGIHIIDSCHLSTSMALMLRRGCRLRDEGRSAGEIAAELEAYKEKLVTSFVVDNLEFIWKGGRCSGVTALGANLLHIKPCLEMQEGELRVGKKYRGTLKKVLPQYVKDKLAQYPSIKRDHLFITYSTIDPSYVELVRQTVEETMEFKEIHTTNASCTIACHCGPNTLGILFETE